jgi:signal transduction histidine kinase
VQDQYSDLLASQVEEGSKEIIGNAETLAEALKDDPRAREYLLNVIKEAKRIQRILSAVQTIRQIKAGQVPTFSRIDLCQILDRSIEEIKQRFNQRELLFPSTLPRTGCKVMANLQLQDLLTNLLDYMVEHNPHTTVTIEVAAKEITWAAESYWQVSFTDKENVIPDEDKDLLFRRDLRPARELPLTILLAEVIAESIKGKIEVTNRIPGDRRHGTVFLVRIPSVKG